MSSKLTALAELTSPDTADLLYAASDPAGVPTSKKVTVANLRDAITAVHRADLRHSRYYDALFQGVSYDRAMICLRFDDGRDEDYAVAYPELISRALPGGFALSPGKLDTANYISTAEGLTMQANGMEILCHSQDHGADPATYAAFVAQTYTARENLRTAGFNVDSFTPPGTWVAGYQWTTEAHLDTIAARALRGWFAAFTGYVADPSPWKAYVAPLPCQDTFRWSYYNTDTATAAQLQTRVDDAILYAGGCRLTFHPYRFNAGGYITSADYITFLAYLKTKRDAGLIDVVTPTAFQFARRVAAAYRLNLFADPSFEASATGAWVGWEIAGGAPTVEALGRTGTNAANLTSANTIRQYLMAGTLRNVYIEFYAKTDNPGVAANVHLHVQGLGGAATAPDLTFTFTAPASNAWIRCQACFAVGPLWIASPATYIRVTVDTTDAAPGVLVDDFAVYKV